MTTLLPYSDYTKSHHPTESQMSTYFANQNTVLGEVQSGKLDISQGTANAGKIFFVNSSGNLELISGLTYSEGHFQYVS